MQAKYKNKYCFNSEHFQFGAIITLSTNDNDNDNSDSDSDDDIITEPFNAICLVAKAVGFILNICDVFSYVVI